MKNAIIVILILICCWLGFMVYQSQNKEASVFDKQKECSALYDQYKDKTKVYISKWKYSETYVDELTVSYSQEKDTCIASWIVWSIYSDSPYSESYTFYIVDALKWDIPIFQCWSEVSKQNNECWLQMWRKMRYNLTK